MEKLHSEEIRYTAGACLLGSILVAASDHGLCAVLLGDDPEALVRDLEKRFPLAHRIESGADMQQVLGRVIRFIETTGRNLDLPLDARGTAFQQRVWQTLREIPAGQTATYSEVACRIGSPGSVRAVGQACAANPLAVVIPCHRVLPAGGGISGYRWGVERKRVLLALEDRQSNSAHRTDPDLGEGQNHDKRSASS